MTRCYAAVSGSCVMCQLIKIIGTSPIVRADRLLGDGFRPSGLMTRIMLFGSGLLELEHWNWRQRQLDVVEQTAMTITGHVTVTLRVALFLNYFFQHSSDVT